MRRRRTLHGIVSVESLVYDIHEIDRFEFAS